jgi:hypothetical protein
MSGAAAIRDERRHDYGSSVGVALISDIHGNDIAFAAAAADMERLDLDRCFCLGDVAQGGPQPAESLARLRGLGCRVVMGNSDHFLLEVPTDSLEPITPEHLELRKWTLGRVSPHSARAAGQMQTSSGDSGGPVPDVSGRV